MPAPSAVVPTHGVSVVEEEPAGVDPGSVAPVVGIAGHLGHVVPSIADAAPAAAGVNLGLVRIIAGSSAP
eukprot:3105532-Pyramimonas_sp.AAC.1